MSHLNRVGYSRRLLSIGVSVALVLGLFLVNPSVARAADASDFDPGFLISDEQFFDSDSLSAAEVTSFINGMNKGCLTGRVCIENYKETTTSKAKNTRCAAITGKSNQTAGQIISTVALACGISPKAIVVILQKEQSLITATAPGSRAFQASMGAGCPDTAPCDATYSGFYENVYYGAYLLKGYTIPGSTHYTRYAAGNTAAIKYHPNAACGTKSVYVKNQATHALYVYTPYTPNAKALSNLYGTGDSCSAYGNRNFWRLYTDWWGPTGSAAALEIDKAYAARNGAEGWLGTPTGDYVGVEARGGGVYRSYAGGTIVFSQKFGLKIISDPLDTYWVSRGDVAALGWPTGSTVRQPVEERGVTQNFELMTLTRMDNKNVIPLTPSFSQGWWAAGGAAGYFGWPTNSRALVADSLYSQKFRNGVVYADGVGYGGVATSLLDAYTLRGGPTGTLGWPAGDPVMVEGENSGTYQSFAKGMLFTSAQGTFPLWSTYTAAFKAAGGFSATGWPLEARQQMADGGFQQSFQKAEIFTYGTQFAVVSPQLADKALASGVITGKLGLPTAKPVTTADGGAYQFFKGAMLTRQVDADAHALVGTMRTAYTSSGRSTGPLGWPTSDVYVDSKVKVNAQDFEHATVFAVGSKYGIVGSEIVAGARIFGVTSATKLGWPKSDQRAASSWGGGYYQHFDGGTVTATTTYGAILVPKVIWSAHTKAGGLKVLGWPTAAAVTNTKTGVITQKFLGGTITYSKSKGAVVKLATS